MVSFKINGTALPVEPKSCSITYQDLDSENSGRAADGILVREVLRRNVIKIELEFAPLTSTKLQTILSMIDSTSFQFTFRDPKNPNNTERTITAYAGDRSMELMRTGYTVEAIPGTSPVKYRTVDLYQGFSFSVIEY